MQNIQLIVQWLWICASLLTTSGHVIPSTYTAHLQCTGHNPLPQKSTSTVSTKTNLPYYSHMAFAEILYT